MHRHFFRKLSQNRECFQTHCNDLYDHLHFACTKWIKDNSSKFFSMTNL